LLVARQELAQDYDVECEIGRGGMAVVYRAVDRHLRRPVALKVLPPELALSRAVVERFKREAQMAAALEHPNIIPIYRVGQSASLLYLAMKYVEGRALDAMIADQGALPIAVVVLVLRAAASAMAYAHEHGIVHRDIKSGNILIDLSGRAIVTDFGVARAIDNASLTRTGTVIGTPYFMSPEQCAGKVAGPQSDQYSLGVVAFQMLTGAVPFQAETLAAIMHHHFFTPIPDVTKVRSDLPPELGAILARLLSKEPSRRFATTAELRGAINAVPLAEADRELGEAMLRRLARGSTLPRVETSSIPPLADTMAMVAAHDALMRSVERFRKVRRRAGMVAGLLLTVVLTLFAIKAAWGPARRFWPTVTQKVESRK
jgi:serine/threonine-protein kinase